MFPGVDGFEWNAGHIVFLGAFFTVLVIIAATVSIAWIRTGRDRQSRKIELLRWAGDFHDLPACDRYCRHELLGAVKQRTCKLKFDCRDCDTHRRWVARHPAPPGESVIHGMQFPQDRMYHRGHAWAKTEEDGTVTVGLDEFGRLLVGTPDVLELPAEGDRVEVNGTAWCIQKAGAAVRVLSPVEGVVVGTASPESPWYLRVKPTDIRTAHLLRGAEIKPWIGRELEKLELLMSGAKRAALPDGGMVIGDASEICPPERWDAVLSGMFLKS